MNLEEKLEILADSAKYDVACTSSGVDRAGQHGKLGSCRAAGICHAFTPDAATIAATASTAAAMTARAQALPRASWLI